MSECPPVRSAGGLDSEAAPGAVHRASAPWHRAQFCEKSASPRTTAAGSREARPAAGAVAPAAPAESRAWNKSTNPATIAAVPNQAASLRKVGVAPITAKAIPATPSTSNASAAMPATPNSGGGEGMSVGAALVEIGWVVDTTQSG